METVHVIEQNCTLHKQFQSIVVRKEGHKLHDIPLLDLKTIIIYGYNQITTQLIHELTECGVTIIFVSMAGTIKGILMSNSSNNITLRLAQYASFQDEAKRLSIGKVLIEAKIKGQLSNMENQKRKLEQTRYDEYLELITKQLYILAGIKDISKLFGVEGVSAKAYFQNFDLLLTRHTFSKRERRPAYDPVNAMLNLTYMTFLRYMLLELMAKGFDCELGFIHGIRYGRESLALDLLEVLRPMADRFVVKILNRRQINDDMFVTTQEEGCRLTIDGMKIYMSTFDGSFGEKGTVMDVRKYCKTLAVSLYNNLLFHRSFSVEMVEEVQDNGLSNML